MKKKNIFAGAAFALAAFSSSPTFCADEAVKASSFGFDPADSTAFLQKALDSGAKRIVIDRQESPWITEPLFVRSNCEIVFERGVELVAKRGSFKGRTDSLITFNGSENVKVSGYGAVLRMHRADYDAAPYAKGEWRMSLNLLGTRNVTIEGLTLLESGGDGVYVGVSRNRERSPCRDTVLRDLVIDRQYRQGISVISARNLLIERCVMRNTWGTPPAAGIDFEPKHENEELAGIVMRDCSFIDNQGVGVEFYVGHLDASSAPISAKIENCVSRGNSRGFAYSNGKGATLPKGLIEVSNCTFMNERGAAASFTRKPPDSPNVAFTNCRFLDCHTRTPVADSIPDITLAQRSPSDRATGGILFRDCVLRQPVERTWITRSVGAFMQSAPLAIDGDITIVTPASTNRVALGAAWCASYFPKPKLAGAPKQLAFDAASAQVHDAKPGEMLKLEPFLFRGAVSYRFYAAAPGPVKFKGRFRKVGTKHVLKPMPILFTDAAGKTLAKVPVKSPETPLDFSFNAPKAGFYVLSVDQKVHAFGLLAATAPVAVIIPGAAPRSLYLPRGTLRFRVAKTSRIAIAAAGEGSEMLSASVKSPDGQTVWNAPKISDWEVYSNENAAPGIWSVSFGKAEGHSFEDSMLCVLGACPDLFLSPYRYW